MTHLDDEGRLVDERPWGRFIVLDDQSSDYKIKEIVVTPGKRLSYQTHARRAEHWFVVSGHATAVVDGETYELGPGHSVDINIGQAHRCENHGVDDVRFIEVQTGTYFGEDDIVRLEDDFGRAN
ncbi:MAG: phosphomannose isomerase type II C-terminal cupin domain [Acidobacteriota bacterium]|nr:phosphomannose isomerase type II C-terminal cupin domain [Acidobacteriota bacterium]MDE3044721.1 phosphomannose isomerase type II C-terminal cupin domain [Acidobacteriota bacterium]MDE3222810.1 phosphomannose isomerase type II C-terminal cupin domain [Acidobacteriota bacterium]